MKEDGHTVLLTTHYIDEAEQLCDRIAIIARGRIVATGTPRDLIARSRATQTVSFMTVPPVEEEAVAGLPGVEEVVCERGEVRFRTGNVVGALAELTKLVEARCVELAELRVRKATLEDVFIELTGSRFAEQ
jgi:ABC-2 type transport system ATP-binding protein